MNTLVWTSGLIFVLASAGCSEEAERAFDFGDVLGPGGKGDMLSSARIVREANLDATIRGNFDPRARVVGASVRVRKGAMLSIVTTTTAGVDSVDVADGAELDTVLAVYGPTSGGKPGPLVVQVDDDDSGGAAQLPELSVDLDGEYLILLATWNDPGKGDYELDLRCMGSDDQCGRSSTDFVADCEPGTEYVVGGVELGTQTWSKCNYIILEETRIAEDATLTIQKGVTVSGSFLGEAPFGSVRLVADGQLHAQGTRESPVIFSAEQDEGWGGLILGSDSRLEHVQVERARVGIEIRGNNSTLTNVFVRNARDSIRYVGATAGHVISDARIEDSENGIDVGRAEIVVEDSVLLGTDSGGYGIRVEGSRSSRFERCLVAQYSVGVDLIGAEFEMVDSTVASNARGVRITGEDAGLHPSFTCPAVPVGNTSVASPTRWPRSQPWPSEPAVWGSDPVFTRVDVVNNLEFGIRVEAPELLVVEETNVIGNGAGIIIESDSLHPDSRIVHNNIYDNADPEGVQLDAYHRNGTLDISGNYWAAVADPELSMRWQTYHDDYRLDDNFCFANVEVIAAAPACTPAVGEWRCGVYSCRFRGSPPQHFECQLRQPLVAAPWESDVKFAGFAPTELLAGPIVDMLSDEVMIARGALGL